MERLFSCRFEQCNKDERINSRLTYIADQWEPLFEQMKTLRANKQLYKVEGLKILGETSRSCGEDMSHMLRLEKSSNDDDTASFSSLDSTPRSLKRTFVAIDDNADQDLDKEVSEFEKWKTDDWDITNILFEYRLEALYHNQRKPHRELSPARILSFGHIFYFPINSSHSCLGGHSSDLVSHVYLGLDIATGYDKVPADIVLYANAILDAYETNEEHEIMKVFGMVMVKASGQTDRRDIRMKAVHILVDIAKHFSRQPHHQRRNSTKQCGNIVGEDTFVHDVIGPFLSNVFYGPNLEHKWANTQLEVCGKSSISSTPPSPSTSSAMTHPFLSRSTDQCL
ncbi:unnamed protein product [Absidia cylindrospora]